MNNLQFMQPNEYKEGDIILTAKQIQERLEEVAVEITPQFVHKNILVIGLLKGAFQVISDLVRLLHSKGLTDIEVDFMQVHSYTSGTTSTYEPKILSEASSTVAGRDILLIDDICDTGRSIEFVTRWLKTRHPGSLKTFVLLDKPSRRTTTFVPDYTGFTIPDIWVQGYGMDTDEKGRGDSNIIKGPYFY